MRVAGIALALGLALPAHADVRVPFECSSRSNTSYWATNETLIDPPATPALDYDTYIDVTQPACTFVDDLDPTAQWDVHFDSTGTYHVFQWPHPDLPTPPWTGQPFDLRLTLRGALTLPVVADGTYRLHAILRPDPLVRQNDAYVQLRCPGMPLTQWFSWTINWPPQWTVPESGVCEVSAYFVCEQDGVEGGIEANARGECHTDLLAYHVTPTRCGIGPELALLIPILFAMRRSA